MLPQTASGERSAISRATLERARGGATFADLCDRIASQIGEADAPARAAALLASWVADGLDYIATWQTGMFQPGDMLEAFSAKSEGRKPTYPDLLPVKNKL